MDVDELSNYETGAFEALEWSWHMMRDYKDTPTGVNMARRAIQDILAHMGKGDMVNFRDQISKIQVYG